MEDYIEIPVKETWKFIGNTIYKISNYGRVKNSKTRRYLKPYTTQAGYYSITLGGNKHYYIHQLVAKAFHKNLKNKKIVNHKDGNKLNNFVWNLEWITYKENSQHAVDIGLNKNKRKILQFDLSMNFIKEWDSIVNASKGLNIGRSNISYCLSGKSRSAGGFIWKYKDDIQKNEIEELYDCMWKTIKDYPTYKISSKGQIIIKKTGKIRKASMRSGYLTIALSRNGKKKYLFLHRLLAIHYIENPLNLPFVNHKDGNKLNNSLENLEWVSCKENTLHAYKSGLMKPTNERAVVQYDIKTGEKIAEYKSIIEASKATGTKPTSLCQNCSGVNKTAGGFIWRYKENAPEKIHIEHKEYKYEKKQCKECGKLISEPSMNRHIKEVHKHIPRGGK